MKYAELNKRVLKAFRKKLIGEGRVAKIKEEAVPGLEYSMMVMTKISKYYELIDDDEERRARDVYFKTVNILKDKINGSDKVKPLDDERIPGIKYSLVAMRAQKKYLECISMQVKPE